MEENSKNKVIIILLVLSIIFLVTTIGSCSNAQRQRSAREKELATRLDAEEKINKTMQDKTTIEERINKLEKQLEEEKAAHQISKDALANADAELKTLQEELDKANEAKNKVEADLKEALAASQRR